MPRCATPVDPCRGRPCVIAPAATAAGAASGRMSRSRTRRRRYLESIAHEKGFLEQVRTAWVNGAAAAEAEDKDAALKGQAAWRASDEMDASTSSPCSRAGDSSSSFGSSGHCSASSLTRDATSPAPVSSVPAHIVESVAECSGGRPRLIAGMPLEHFWDHLERFGKKDSAASILQRMLAFRKKYKWPLTMTTADVGDTLLSGAFQYLPPLPQDSRPVLLVTPRMMDTSKCSIEQYQKLVMLALEAAFRASADCADGGDGLLAIVDLRGTSAALARGMLASFSDLARSVAMCRGSLPTSISHLHFIESDAPSNVLKAIVNILMSNLHAKVQARVSFGSQKVVLEAVGAQMLPASLGGQRDDVSEWRDWLRVWRAEEVASGLVASGGPPT